jgi:hypothetical protein
VRQYTAAAGFRTAAEGHQPLGPAAPTTATDASSSNSSVATWSTSRGPTRRVEKRVYNWDVQDPNDPHWDATPTTVRRFLWSGWRLVLEMDGLSGGMGVSPVIRRYTWGLDLAGLGGAGISPAGDSGSGAAALQAAGGIGGLLVMQATGAGLGGSDLNYVYLYDANGNVGQLIDWSHDANDPNGAIGTRYEYDPYSNVTARSGRCGAAKRPRSAPAVRPAKGRRPIGCQPPLDAMRSSSFGRNHTRADGVPDQPYAIVDAQLAHHRGLVAFHRLRAAVQFPGDLADGQAAGQVAQNLRLAGCEG